MKVLIDTNLVLDLLLNRTPFVANAVKIFEQAEKGFIEAYLTANSVTDIVYILRKAYSSDQIRNHLQNMFGFIKIMNVTASDIFGALKLDLPDFEDAVLMQCAKAVGVDFIVTRNNKDFIDCPVACLSIEEWIERFCKS
jgi:predicted nucleic acid-binding protein